RPGPGRRPAAGRSGPRRRPPRQRRCSSSRPYQAAARRPPLYHRRKGEAMLSTGTPVGNIQPYFLTQVVPDLDPAKVLDQQPELTAITGQALAVADIFTGFIAGARTSLDIAIYDFRLLPGDLTDKIVGAVQDAAGRGVAVRLAYDKTTATDDDATLKAFAGEGGDPGTSHIMHQKYIVRDAGTADAAVLTGSANFTTDAWGIQENNVLVIS